MLNTKQKAAVSVKPAYFKAAMRIAPGLTRCFTRDERAAAPLEVLETALFRGMLAMEREHVGRGEVADLARAARDGQHSLLVRSMAEMDAERVELSFEPGSLLADLFSDDAPEEKRPLRSMGPTLLADAAMRGPVRAAARRTGVPCTSTLVLGKLGRTRGKARRAELVRVYVAVRLAEGAAEAAAAGEDRGSVLLSHAAVRAVA